MMLQYVASKAIDRSAGWELASGRF